MRLHLPNLAGASLHAISDAVGLLTVSNDYDVLAPTALCLWQVLATYHCDQAYAFDVTADGACTSAYSPAASVTAFHRQAASDSTDTSAEGINSHRSEAVSFFPQVTQLQSYLPIIFDRAHKRENAHPPDHA